MKHLCQFVIVVVLTVVYINISRSIIPEPLMVRHITLSLPGTEAKSYDGLDTVQLDCMARNIFFEARGESAKGKAMVGFVVLARTQSPHFPDTVCDVVHQANVDHLGRKIRYECSFSWYCDGINHKIDYHNPVIAKEWEQSLIVARLVMLGKVKPPINMRGVTHYHAKYVHPFWANNKNYRLVARVGDHLFYRWKKAMLPKYEPAIVAMN